MKFKIGQGVIDISPKFRGDMGTVVEDIKYKDLKETSVLWKTGKYAGQILNQDTDQLELDEKSLNQEKIKKLLKVLDD